MHLIWVTSPLPFAKGNDSIKLPPSLHLSHDMYPKRIISKRSGVGEKAYAPLEFDALILQKKASTRFHSWRNLVSSVKGSCTRGDNQAEALTSFQLSFLNDDIFHYVIGSSFLAYQPSLLPLQRCWGMGLLLCYDECLVVIFMMRWNNFFQISFCKKLFWKGRSWKSVKKYHNSEKEWNQNI